MTMEKNRQGPLIIDDEERILYNLRAYMEDNDHDVFRKPLKNLMLWVEKPKEKLSKQRQDE